MRVSSYFATKIKQAEKQERQNSDFNKDQSLSETFVRVLAMPEVLGQELYDRFGPEQEKLLVVLDFFHNDINQEEGQALDDEEWREVMELVNSFAQHIELEELQQMMQFFMDRHII